MGKLKLQHHYDEVRSSLEKYIKENGLEETINSEIKNVRAGIPDERRKLAMSYGMWFKVERDVRYPISREKGVDDSHIASLMEKICKDMGIFDKF